MAATGLVISFYRWRGMIIEPQRPVRFLVRHAIKVVPRARFLDENGVALDLTGVTVRYSLRHVPSATLIVNRENATAEDQSTNPGEAYYQLLEAHVSQSLECVEDWELAYGGSVTESFPAHPLPQIVRIIDDADGA